MDDQWRPYLHSLGASYRLATYSRTSKNLRLSSLKFLKNQNKRQTLETEKKSSVIHKQVIAVTFVGKTRNS